MVQRLGRQPGTEETGFAVSGIEVIQATQKILVRDDYFWLRTAKTPDDLNHYWQAEVK